MNIVITFGILALAIYALCRCFIPIVFLLAFSVIAYHIYIYPH